MLGWYYGSIERDLLPIINHHGHLLNGSQQHSSTTTKTITKKHHEAWRTHALAGIPNGPKGSGFQDVSAAVSLNKLLTASAQSDEAYDSRKPMAVFDSLDCCDFLLLALNE